MNYSLSTAAEGFVPSHAPLKNNKQLNIPFQSTQPRRGKNKTESQGLTPSSRVRACRTKRGAWGCASILSVMPSAAPDSQSFLRPEYWPPSTDRRRCEKGHHGAGPRRGRGSVYTAEPQSRLASDTPTLPTSWGFQELGNRLGWPLSSGAELRVWGLCVGCRTPNATCGDPSVLTVGVIQCQINDSERNVSTWDHE